ncbi:hypothetical protein EJ07DRAFT_165189 [Lizonia empirigonia]|nr:hypothetical protein EJ07DRAFT_165189 [Lizonia empirigonia]
MIAQNLFLLSLLTFQRSCKATTNVLPIVGPQHFDVAVSTASLTDTGRLDPFAKDGRHRKVMVSLFAPVANCRRKTVEAYMPPATAVFENDKYAAYGLPNGSFSALSIQTCKGTCMLQSVAAAGYLVVSVDHPYDADTVEFPDGTVVTGIDIESDADVELAVTTRVDDLAFVYRQLGNYSFANTNFPGYGRAVRESAQKTAIFGHSLGGAAAAAAVLAIPSIRGGANLDGSMFGSVANTGLKQPFMLMGHDNKTQETDPSWKAIWPKVTGWKREFKVKKAAHYSFSDVPLVVEVLGLQGQLPQEVGQVLGTVDGSRMMNITVSYVAALLDLVLKGKSNAILNGSKSFSEVILRAE